MIRDPDARALAIADVIVVGDEPFALGRFARFRIVDRHRVGRPDLATGDVRAPQAADGRHTLIGLDDGFAVRVVPGDDAPYFKSHTPSFAAMLSRGEQGHSWRARNRSTIEFLF